MKFSITKLIGVDYLLNRAAASVDATRRHLFGVRSMYNGLEKGSNHGDTTAADIAPAVVPVSGNGHQVPMTPSRPLASANVHQQSSLRQPLGVQ